MSDQRPAGGAAPQAFYFGPAGTESFGWLHDAQEGAPVATLGVVLCSTLGRQEVCTHRLMRHLAIALAELNIPALRFDYPGTGESATPEGQREQASEGDAPLTNDADLADPGAWIASIGQAIDTLKAATGVPKVCVLGLEAGAMLACQSIQGRSDVAGLIALAPVLKGRAWLRELRAFGMRAAQQSPSPSTAEYLESGSHAFTAQAQIDLGRLDLLTATTPPAQHVLVLEPDNQPGRAAAWVAHLQTLGTGVDYRPLTGYEALMAPPHQSLLPRAAMQDVLDWVRTRAAGEYADISAPPARLAAAGTKRLRLAAGRTGRLAVTEQACLIDPAIGLSGILSQPECASGQPPPTHAVVLLPAGADRRIGPGRLYVSLARQLAAAGLAVLRLDISGVGDSPARPGCEESVVYAPQALQDVDAAVRHMREVLGIRDVSLVGYCSGSYNVFKAAVAGTPVQTLVLINPLVFFWKPGMSLSSDTSEALVAYAARNYRRNIWRAGRWRALLRSPRKMMYAMQVLWRRPASILQHSLRDLARQLNLPLKDDLGRELLDLAKRGTSLRFIFATGDPGESLLRATGGAVVRRLIRTGALRIDHIADADHEFTQRRHRLELAQVLVRLLTPQSDPAATPAASKPR